jgi:hypothetical protein
MSTVAYPEIRAFADAFEDLFKSAICSGICGDRSHQKRGGYHIGRKFQPSTNYSVIRADDRPGRGPDDAATAVDMSMNRADMVLATRRLMHVYSNDRDPRRKYINAFNGWLGSGQPQRWDMVKRVVGRATRDHTSHVHLELRRAYARSRVAHKAVLSALRGETIAQYLTSIGLKPYAPDVKALTPRYPGHVLQRTASTKPDPGVKLWQQRMIARGWKTIGKADGHFGAKTEGAVRRFQKVCRVPVDGKIGPKTWPLPWVRPLG